MTFQSPTQSVIVTDGWACKKDDSSNNKNTEKPGRCSMVQKNVHCKPVQPSLHCLGGLSNYMDRPCFRDVCVSKFLMNTISM